MPAGAADLVKRRIRGGMPTPSEAPACPSSATRLRIAWAIGPGAAELHWSIDGDRATATLRATEAEADTSEQPLAESRITRRIRDERAGLDHLEVEGLLWLTLRPNNNNDDAPPELLFARTTLFTRLNIPPGTYTAPRLL